MKETVRFFLSAILLVAGVLHLIRPEIFAPAIFWGYEDLSNYVAGVLEIILAILLWTHPRLGGTLTAVWLVLLLPVLIYISIEGLRMFGFNSKLILWGRTSLQFPPIYWAWSLRNK